MTYRCKKAKIFRELYPVNHHQSSAINPMIKEESCYLIGQPNQNWKSSGLTFPWWITPHKKKLYQLIISRDIDNQRSGSLRCCLQGVRQALFDDVCVFLKLSFKEKNRGLFYGYLRKFFLFQKDRFYDIIHECDIWLIFPFYHDYYGGRALPW